MRQPSLQGRPTELREYGLTRAEKMKEGWRFLEEKERRKNRMFWILWVVVMIILSVIAIIK